MYAKTISIYNSETYEAKVAELIARAKGLTLTTYKTTPDTTHPRQAILVDGIVKQRGILSICMYLEERFPAPTLLPETPAKRAAAITCANDLLEHPEYTDDLNPPRAGFLLGQVPGIIDLFILPYIENRPGWEAYVKRVKTYILCP